MFEETVQPQISDTDIFGHVNYLASAFWFDRCRTPLYRELSPELTPDGIGAVILKTEVLYKHEVLWNTPVNIQTYVSHIGHKSFTVVQEARQNDILCVRSEIVFCGFDYTSRTAIDLSEKARCVLSRHFINPQQ